MIMVEFAGFASETEHETNTNHNYFASEITFTKLVKST